MPRKRSELSQITRAARRRRAKRAAARQRAALNRLLNATYEMPGWMPGVQFHHFTPDQFESNRADGKVKLKPNAIPTIFYEYKPPRVHKAPAVRKKVPKRPRRCSVAGCKSNSRSQNETVSTFPLPRNEKLKRKWLRKIPSDISRWKTPVICIKHFGEKCLVRTEQCIVDGEVASSLRSWQKLKPNAVPTIFPKHTTRNQSLKRRRTPRKSQTGDNKKKKPHPYSQKSLQAAKNFCTGQGEQIIAGGIAEMMEVDWYPHMCCVNVKQEPEDFANEKHDGCVNEEVDLYTHMCTVNIKQETEDYENEMLGGCADEEFAADGLVTTEFGVFIKEEPELDVDTDADDFSEEPFQTSEEPFQTSVCSDNNKEKTGRTLAAARAEENVNKFAEAFVPEWCLASIKQEVV